MNDFIGQTPVVAVATLLVVGCQANHSTTASDDTPPAKIADLVATSATPAAIRLSWTAPGDDGIVGRAAGYDIRYSPEPLSGDLWTSASIVNPVPTPNLAGAGESIVVSDLDPDMQYHFALRAADEIPNWSEWSRTATAISQSSCELSPQVLDFGDVLIWEIYYLRFMITNQTETTLAGTVSSPSPEFILYERTRYFLNPGQVDTIGVAFQPNAPGNRSCKIDTGLPSCLDLVCFGVGRTMGACCLYDTCYEVTQYVCAREGGVYLGDGTECEPDPCDL